MGERNSLVTDIEFNDYVPPLSVSEALAIRSLAVNEVMTKARVVSQKDSMTRFVLYDAIHPEQEIESDKQECFLGVCVGRVALNSWTMRISFLDLSLEEGSLYSNRRELYRFDWGGSDVCFGGKSVYQNKYEIIGRDFTESGEVTDTLEEQRFRIDLPVEEMDCDALADRMLDVTRRMSAKPEAHTIMRFLP